MSAFDQLRTALADRYRVEREIGAGGMATVYIARDLRHERNVALKVLRPELGAVLGIDRFLSEIRVTANLQHPHLLPLFDSGEADRLLFYVMPFVEGESLRARLEREKQLPVPEAIRITVAVAGALDYAHRHNVVHRDLKPENILMQDGQPVVSDFGIALAVTNAGGTRITQTGLSLGTPQYMSPEQATGDRVIDARSDIYSLAAVLYEMLTGEPPHSGATVQAIIARVLTDRPQSVRVMRDTVPENVDAALQRALAKLPADRFATAHEFAEAIQDQRYTLPASMTTATAPATPARGGRRSLARYFPWGVAAVAVVAASWSLTRTPAASGPPAPARFDLALPAGVSFSGTPGTVAIAQDGSRIAMVVWSGGKRFLAVRSLNDPEVRVLEGTEAATAPFFSPDGASLGFVVDGSLRVVTLAGGGVATLSSDVTRDVAWGHSGIVFARGAQLLQLSSSGGSPVPFTKPDSAHTAYTLLSAAPGGRTLMVAGRPGAPPELAVAEPDGVVRLLGQTGLRPIYLDAGYVLFNSLEGNLMALPVDARTLAPHGNPILVLDGISMGATGVAIWSASSTGTIVAERGAAGRAQLVLVSRSGQYTRLSDEARRFRMPRLSPDGNRIAIQATGSGTNADADIWIFDRRTSALSRFTSGGGNSDAIWTPDGRRIAWAGAPASDTGATNREVRPELRTGSDIFWQAADRTGTPEVIYAGPGSQWPWSFTPDGGTVLFDDGNAGTRIMAVTVGGGNSPTAVVANDYSNRLGMLSPDGRRVAYTSNETGRWEVYVRPFPGPGGAMQVSVDGGNQPMWSRDGRELFYRDGVNLIAASLGDGTVQGRTVLFEDTFERSNATNYDVLPGGGFVMLRGVGEAPKLTVLVNWATEIERRARAVER